MTPINFALPGFFKKASGFDGIQEDLPPITSNLEIFFDPDYAVFSDDMQTLANDGDYVREVWDRSSTGNTLSQSAAQLQPLYDTSEFGNGKASLFTGSYDSLDIASAIVIPSTSSFTFHTVYKKDVIGDYSASIGNRGGEDSAHINHRSSYVRVSDDSNQYNWNSFSDDTTLKIISIVVDRSANTISVYKNGVLSVSNSITYSDTFTFRTLFTHSGIPGTNTYWGNILMYEDAHSADQVFQVSEWLGDKYDILVAPITENLEFYVSPDKEVYSDAGTTLAADGNSIRQINDLSGNDNTIEQATASHQFEYVEDHFGTGKAAIYKDTAHGPHMDFASTLSIDSDTTGGITFYSVYDKTNNSNISYLFGTTDGNFNRILEYGNHSIYFQDENNVKHYAGITDSKDLAIRAFTLDTSTDTVKTYDNGELDGNSSLSKTWGTFDFDSFWGGANTSYIGNTLLFSDVHDADQVIQMTRWLGDKYDIRVAPITENLALYFNPEEEVYSDAGSTLATDGDYIREWDDRSTNDNDLDQPTASSQLKYKTSLLNSKNGVEATSNTDMLLSNTISLQGCTIYAVNKKSSTSAEMMPAGGSGNVTIGNNYSDGNTYLYDGTNAATLSVGHFTDWGVRAYVWDYGTDFEVFENNSSLGSVSATNVGSITIDRLFGRGNGSAGTKNCMEILVFTDTHDATQIESMSDWLMDKYGLRVAPITNNLSFYLDPDKEVYSDAGTTLATDGDNIRQWNGQSDNTVTLSQASGSRQMTYHEGNLNGKNSVYRTGTAQRMKITPASNISGSEDFTLYTVFNREDLNDMVHVSRFYNGKVVDGSTTSSYYGGNNVSSDVTGLSSSTGTTVIRSYVMDRTNQNFLIYENGSLIGTNTDTSSSSGIYIDRIFNGGTPESGSAYYGEVLFYEGSAHDSTETSTMHNWLNEKYNTY